MGGDCELQLRKEGVIPESESGTGEGRQGTALALAPCSVPEEMLSPTTLGPSLPPKMEEQDKIEQQ